MHKEKVTTTNTPTPATTRDEAEQIARSFGFDKDGFVTCDPAALIDAIDKALKARDERAAKIAEVEAGLRCMKHQQTGKGVCGYEIAAAIRADD